MIKIFHFLFFSFLESISDVNLPCQVLFQYSSGKSDYLNVVFRLRLSAIARFKNGRVQSKELGLAARNQKWRHMRTPMWLIVYAIWRTEKYPCFFWVDSYKMPPRHCVVQHCDRVSNKELGISMHESPRTFMERVKWKRFVRQHRKNFNPKGPFSVCSLHFTSDCFTCTVHVKGTERRLKAGSVPTIWKEASVSLSERSRWRVSEFAELFFRAYLSLCCDIFTNQACFLLD